MKKNIRLFVTFQIICILFFIGCKKNTMDVPGKIEQFDPIESLPEVAEYAGDGAMLVNLYARYVKPDGTLNLNEDYGPYVQYLFIIPCITEGQKYTETTTPLGVKNELTAAQVPYWEYVSVIVENPHWESYSVDDEDYDEYDAGMERAVGGGIYELEEANRVLLKYKTYNNPISFYDIWQKTITAGAPGRNVVASIYYYEGNYIFTIDGTEYNYNFDNNGELF